MRLLPIAAIATLLLGACALPSANERLAADASDGATESICINNQTYQGCCSGNGGVRNIRGRQLLCNSGNLSPSCNGDISTKLRGCCSYNEGIDHVAVDGVVYCINETRSKSCRIYLRGCDNA
ncbi:MAG: hypothetical protein R3C60_01030 [Parvularculaceae bacterium]